MNSLNMNNIDNKIQKSKIFARTNKIFYLNVLGTLLPIILSIIAIIIFSKYDKIGSFVTNGTLCICSANFFTISNYLLTENLDSVVTKIDKLLEKYAIAFLILTAAVYSLMYVVDGLKLIDQSIMNMPFVWIFSLVFFSLSLYSLYRGIYLESLSKPPSADPREVNQEQVSNIMSQLH